jgi:hypothetical protein
LRLKYKQKQSGKELVVGGCDILCRLQCSNSHNFGIVGLFVWGFRGYDGGINCNQMHLVAISWRLDATVHNFVHQLINQQRINSLHVLTENYAINFEKY